MARKKGHSKSKTAAEPGLPRIGVREYLALRDTRPTTAAGFAALVGREIYTVPEWDRLMDRYRSMPAGVSWTDWRK